MKYDYLLSGVILVEGNPVVALVNAAGLVQAELNSGLQLCLDRVPPALHEKGTNRQTATGSGY